MGISEVISSPSSPWQAKDTLPQLYSLPISLWPRIKADIDSNMLSPIALVTVYSVNPGDLGKNHQVLAYGYELDDSNQLTLHVCDPNTTPEQADSVRLILNLSNPTHTTPIDSNVNIGESVRGFFQVPYAFSRSGFA